jgi:hypothetical protein
MPKAATQLKKPTLGRNAVLEFAEGKRGRKATATRGRTESPGGAPEGDVRLTANIRNDLHMRLKIRAVQERTTVGELIEAWIEGWKP